MLDTVELAFERAGGERVAQADMQPFGADRLDHEIDRARAHRRDDVVDAAMRGLHDHRHGDRVLSQARQDAETVEVRHHQVEDHAVDRGAARPGEQRRAGVAAFGDHDLIAEFLQHALEEPALHRIVIDNENGQSVPLAASLQHAVPFRGTLADRA